jgi:2-O-methyltransferase
LSTVSDGQLSADEIKQLVGKNDPVILDVGANSGQTTAQLLHSMPGATIYAFEPDPRAIAKFRATVSHPNVHLFECAIGGIDGSADFHQSSGGEHLPGYSAGWDQSGSIRRPNTHLEVWPWVKFEQRITVPIMTLDTWSERHRVSGADLIWADVQGAESDLIQGAKRFLCATRYLYTEYSNQEWYEGQITLAGILKSLPKFELVKQYTVDALLRNKRFEPTPMRFTYPPIKV